MQAYYRKLGWVAFLILLFALSACGTFEVGMEPEVTVQATDISAEGDADAATATTTLESVPPVLTSIPTVDSETSAAPTAGPTLVPTPVPEPASAETSPLWTEYRDPYYGYGIALPCYWVIYPGVPDRPSTPIISSYDEWFYLNRSTRGSWKDAVVPEGAYAFDFNVYEEVEPSMSLVEGVEAFIAGQAAQAEDLGHPFAEVSAIEEVMVGPNPAVLVTKEMTGDSAYDLIMPNQYHALRLSPERILFIFAKTKQALESPEVQDILASLALTPEDEVIKPSRPPRGPLEDREVYLNEEAGYCFSYPSEFALETYQSSSPSFFGEVVSLKLERPFYTVGMTVKSWRFAEGAELSQLVDNYLLQFDEPASIERNGPQWYAQQIDGKPVEVLDNVPGAAAETLELFVHDGDKVIQLTTSPTITGNPDSSADAGLVFGVVTTSFTFLR